MIARCFTKKVTVIAAAVAMLLVLGSRVGFATGLAVEPGGLLIQHIEPGERYDLETRGGLRLKIINRSAEMRTYRILVATPEHLGIKRWIEGYTPIPEPRWFSVEPAELAVPPQDTGYARMFIKTPAEARYFNQHWVVALAVQARPKPGETLALVLKPVYYLETESRVDVTAWPRGSPGIAPTILRCDEAPTTEKQAGISCGQLKIFNGDSRPHTYSISSETPQATAGGQKITPSPGFTWLANPESVVVSANRFTLEQQESRSISVRLVLRSDKPVPTHKRECLLWVRPEQGSPGFVRLQFR